MTQSNQGGRFLVKSAVRTMMFVLHNGVGIGIECPSSGFFRKLIQKSLFLSQSRDGSSRAQ
jgi:hypothetical protein